MNHANAKMRNRTAVDCLNSASLFLLKMEGDQFEEQCTAAWSKKHGDLTPIGQKMIDEINKMQVRGFRVMTEEKNVKYVCTVKDVQGRLADNTVVVPKEDTFGSRFGHCSCGVTQMDSVPCIHIAAIAKLSKVPGFNMGNDMTYWWSTAQWHHQFLIDTVVNTNLMMSMIKGVLNLCMMFATTQTG